MAHYQCPDNSTDCLLRAILKANTEFNWDPLTFGFTAVFTIIAFCVSVVALFQSFVAAGPGRLKASERAIGPSAHQKRTITQFNWKEFRFRTIVNVPVFEAAKILEHIPSVVKIEDDEPLVISARSRIVAGWSQLIRDLSLGGVDFNTIECLTDYLPEDIPAAPAWAHVETIVLLAIMKGCVRLIVNEDGFLSANGPSSQLSWNMHPTLGPIAVYRTWDIKQTFTHKLEDVQKMIPVFRGDLYLAGNKVLKLLPLRRNDIPVVFDFLLLKAHTKESSDRCHHEHDHCANRKNGLWAGYLASKSQDVGDGVEKRTAALTAALFADRPGSIRAFPSEVTKMHPALKTIYDEFFPWLILAGDLDDSILDKLCGSSFVEFDDWDAKPDVSCLFDHGDLISWLAVAAQQTSSKSELTHVIERPTLVQPDPVTLMKNRLSKTNPQVSFQKLQVSSLRISRTAVQNVARWLADDTYFTLSTPAEIGKAKEWLTWQLAELDWFISAMGDDAICAASNLVALGCIKFGLVHYTSIPRRFVLPETLDAFNLNWVVDPNDEGSIAIEGYVEKEELRKLYNYSREYINAHRENMHTVKCPQTAQGYYYATNKSLPKLDSKSLQEESKPTSNDAVIDANNPMKDDESSLPKMAEIEIHEEELEHGSQPFSAETQTVVDTKVDTDLSALLRDPLHEWVKTTGTSEDEVAVNVDSRVAALEALTFFRACVYGALLGTGADTSALLISDKRYQLVQVS